MGTSEFDNETVKRLSMGDLPGELDRARRTLERVPEGHFEWRPHAKSMSLHELSAHLVNLLFWMTVTLQETEFDLASPPDERLIPQTVAELLALFDEQAAVVARSLDEVTAADLLLDWTLREGEEVFFIMPRGMAMRIFCVSHLVHHRAQLGVCLRMLDVSVPWTYGPTADEPEMG